MKIRLKFLEPYRLRDWVDESERNLLNRGFMRTRAFAAWHKSKETGRGQPFIAGTLLRSRLIRAVEELLVFTKGMAGDVPCCPGKFRTEDKAKKIHLRRNPALKWTNQDSCTDADPCPLCLILGRYDEGKNPSKKTDIPLFHVHFGNLKLPEGIDFGGPGEIATKRTINRVDQDTGKAHDFFHIWEVDHARLSTYTGNITIADKVSPAARKLLTDGLRYIDRICGALCIIEFPDGDHDPYAGKDFKQPVSFQDVCIADAKAIAEAIDDNGGPDRLRVLSSVIRELRRNKALVETLPLDVDGKEKHFLWDVGVEQGKKSARQILKARISKIDSSAWRRYCELLGEALYQIAKEGAGGIQLSRRILGEADLAGKTDLTVRPSGRTSKTAYEHIVTGKLTSETPFFFGVEYPDEKQVALTTLLNSKNQYRLPRSALRGILRRDLRYYFGTGCNVELGPQRPCTCDVCKIMNRITLKDVTTELEVPPPPEVRQRIRMNPFTGSVDKGALFDMEVGPAGIDFPFEIRYRGSVIPKALETVLSWWHEGCVFFSGAAATGKGRFELNVHGKKTINFSDDKQREAYLANCGWRNNIESLDLESFVPVADSSRKPLWEEMSVSLSLSSPLLNADPIRALIHPEGYNKVPFDISVYGEDGSRYAYKAESFRGVVRSAVGRRQTHPDIDGQKKPLLALAHQDCECLLCRIFGSEYETGKLQFEDLLSPPDTKPVVFDHVAIDRFTGGAADQKKFNELALPASPDANLLLEGKIWKRSDLTNDEDNLLTEALDKALTDLIDGIYALGANGGIGYGRVVSIEVKDENGEAINALCKSATDEKYTSPLPEKRQSDIKPVIDKNAVYYPYYFLKPAKIVDRKPLPQTHDWLDPELLTGKIRCRLTTLSPLIVPDTSDDDYFNLSENNSDKADGEYPKSYAFFNINGEPMIPGSEIRGMVSSVYEAVTNSCFRIFDEAYRLSWRMPADAKLLEEYKPGRIVFSKEKMKNGGTGFAMQEMTEVRYPFYDMSKPDRSQQDKMFLCVSFYLVDENALEKIRQEEVPTDIVNRLKNLCDKKYTNEKSFELALRGCLGRNNADEYKATIFRLTEQNGNVPFYDHPTPTDRRLLSLTGPNRRLARIGEKAEYKIIKHRPGAREKDAFMFVATPAENTEGYGKQFVYQDQAVGYLKVSGPNKVEKKNEPTDGLPGCPESWGSFVHNSVSLSEVSVMGGKDRDVECVRRRIVPEFACTEKSDSEGKSGVTYSMTKRCERVFLETEFAEVNVGRKAIEKYEILIKEYLENAERQETPTAFQTILPENGTVNHGDLVYFRMDKTKSGENEVVEIVPVRISRKVDDKHIAKRLDRDLRPCHGQWIEDENLTDLNNYPEKKLFTRHEKGLCPACRLFGTGSYRGRLKFGFARPTGETRWAKENGGAVTLPLLERPRPTWAIRQPEPGQADDKKVPGRKFYVHHNGWQTVLEGKHPTTGEPLSPNKNNRTVQPLDKDNEFEFEIVFENLEPYELGLLLHTLRLEKGQAHKLGMAKSMGFGSVEIDVTCVKLNTAAGEWIDGSDPTQIEAWIGEGKVALKDWLGGKWENLPHIQDLSQLLYMPGPESIAKVYYPHLEKPEGSNLPDYKDLKESFDPLNLSKPWTPWAQTK